MKCIELDIPYMFVDSLTSLMERIVGFPVKSGSYEKEIKSAEAILIQSKGVFQSRMIFQMETSLEQAVLDGMRAGKDVSSEMKKLYLGEFVNILSGHALTSINNAVGETSRLTLPIVGAENLPNDTQYEHRCVLHFTSEYGNMELQLNYELSTETCVCLICSDERKDKL